MPKKAAQITHYAEYLRLDQLLGSQQPLSESQDELHFITIHQIHELWFKLAIYHLKRACDAVDADQPTEATRLIAQVTEIFQNLQTTARHLNSMPPASFHAFRHLLSPASGMQSFQFREIELIAGRRDPAFLAWVQKTFPRAQDWAIAEKHLAESSLAERLDALVERSGVADLATLYSSPDRWPEVYALAEALSVFEHTVSLWRQMHMQLIERTIGAGTTGTGGMDNSYLQRASQTRFFPKLWEARNELSRRVEAEE